MKTYLIPALIAPLFFSGCEEKNVTVNPPGETKETTIIKEAPATTTEKKVETETKIGPGGTTTEKKETIEKK